MGDAGEGLVDNDARIQERQDELQRAREERRSAESRDPQKDAERESLRLARSDILRQLDATTHERRRAALTDALAELDRRMAELTPGH
jgi:hypothetical protein